MRIVTNSDSLYRRRPAYRPNKSLYVFCEGEKTEPLYFMDLKNELRLSNIKIYKGGNSKSSPKELIDFAKRRLESEEDFNNRLDEVWCVFDLDTLSESEIRNFLSSRIKTGFKFATSNPCFEYWFLLHFKKTDKEFQNSAELINDLEKYLPNYRKNDHVYKKINNNYGTALINCKEMVNQNPDHWRDWKNPSTNVYRLVEALQNQ